MRVFPEKRHKHSILHRLSPTYADVLCGLVDDPEIGRFLVDPPIQHNKTSSGLHPGSRSGEMLRRERASHRMVSWLEHYDPLGVLTINMLLDVTESWPPRMERAFWKEVAGHPLKFLDMYSEIRELAEERAFPVPSQEKRSYSTGNMDL